MTKKANKETTVTPEFVVCWPHLFEAYAWAPPGQQPKEEDKRYSVEMLFTAEAIAELKKCAAKVAKAEWPERDFKELKFPFKNGDALADKAAAKGKNKDYYRNFVMVRARSKYPTSITDMNNKEIIDPKRIFAGCHGAAEITFAAYENPADGDGINIYLNHYRHTREGDRIGGADTSAIFAGVTGGQADVDPMDDEIPF